ncbi:Hypothetical predicted protein [Prunus dulcis]|uniref:Uncharacterized protein n=1 Tax=Prunus dulcis TaxID=3755 RepID=A0A5E4F1S3_PRUDU|nr:Hypothetical predicted protein [Prunus dulcis]
MWVLMSSRGKSWAARRSHVSTDRGTANSEAKITGAMESRDDFAECVHSERLRQHRYGGKELHWSGCPTLLPDEDQ